MKPLLIVVVCLLIACLQAPTKASGLTYSYYVYVTDAPLNFVTLTAFTQNSLVVTPSKFTFTAATMNISFTVQETAYGTSDVINWGIGGTDSVNYTIPANSYIPLQTRTIDLNRGYTKNFPGTSTIGIPTSSFAVGLQAYPPSGGGVTLTPVSSTVTFTPSSFVWTGPTEVNIVFNYVVNAVKDEGSLVYWKLTGPNADWYGLPANVTIFPNLRTISFSPFQTSVPINLPSDVYRFSMDYSVPSIQIIPNAPNVKFYPSTLTIGDNNPTGQLYFVGSTLGAAGISFSLGGQYSTWFGTPQTQYVMIAQKTFTVSYGNADFGTVVAGVLSPVYSITADYPPANDVTVQLSGSPGSGINFYPPSLTFTQTQVTNTFQFIATEAVGGTISFSLGGDDQANFVAPEPGTVTVNQLSIQDPNMATTMNCGDVGSYVLSVNAPPPNGVTVNIYGNGLVFSPNSFTFTPTISVIPFTVTAVFPGTSSVKYSLSGTDSGLFGNLPGASITVSQKTITLPDFSDDLYAGVIAPFVITLDYPPVSDLTITPYGSGLAFSPKSFVFNQNSPLSVSFIITPTIPGSVTISYQVTGTDVGAYNQLPNSVVNVSPVVLVTPTAMDDVPVFEWSAPYTVYFQQQLTTPINITFYGLDLNFSPTSLILSPTSPSGYFTVQGVKTGAKIVKYSITGPGWTYVSPTAPCGVNITPRQFTMPATLPDVYAQVSSNPITIGLTYLPFNGITIQPSAPDTDFSPAVLTFDPHTRVQNFTYVAKTGSATGISRAVTWLISGADAEYYVAPAGDAFNVFLRPLDISAPIQPTFGIPFVFTVTTPITPTNGLTLTPVGAHTFSPASAVLGPVATGGPASVSFTATPTMLGASPVKVVITGADAALYTHIADIELTTQQATFVVHLPSALNLTYGQSSGPILVSTTISTAHDVSLTINSPQVIVSPNVLTFGPTTTVATFEVFADPTVWSITESGVVTFSYVVGGTDAQYFAMGPNSVVASVAKPFKTFTVSTSSLKLFLGTPSTFTVTLNDNPPNGFTLTPTVETNSGITITPPSVTFSEGNYAATFSVVTNFAFSPATSIGMTVTGPDAFLYKDQAAAAAIGISFQSGVITTNFPSTVKAGQLQVVEFMDVSGIIPQSNLTVTPFVISGPNITINPPQLVFSPTVLSARYTILAATPGVAVVGYTVTGGDVSWFQMDALSYTLSVQGLNFVGFDQGALSSDNLVVGVTSRTFTVNVDYLPPTGVTLTPYSPDLTFNPPSFTFNPTVGAVSFTITPITVSRSSAISISFSVSGPDSVLYTVPATITTAPVLPRALTLSVPGNLVGGTASQVTLLAQYPPPTSVSITPMAAGFTFNPSTVTILAGQSSASLMVTAIASGLTDVAVTYVISGDNAAWYSTPAGSSLSVPWGQIQIPGTVDSGYPITVPVSITPPPSGEVTVTPVAAGVTFTPASITFTNSITSLSFSAASQIQGQVQVTYLLSGSHSQYYNLPVETQETMLTFSQLSLLVTQGAAASYIAGSQSAPVVLNIGTSATNFVAVTSPVIIIPYADVPTTFNPANITILPGAHTATFTYTTTSAGPVTIGFQIGGDAAPLFTVPPSISFTASPRSFDIEPNLFTNTMATTSSSVFTYGVASQSFTIFAKSVPVDVSLTPVSDKFTFEPETLYFNQNTTSAHFTMTGKNIGPAVISFVVGGTDAAAFTLPAAHTYARVTYKINFPVIPSLTVGVASEAQTVSISPAPITPFSLTLPQPGNVVFSPSQLVFAAGETAAKFIATAYETTISNANAVSVPGVVSAPSTPSSYSFWNMTGRQDGESVSYVVPLETFTSINVLPGTFTLHHPRYQMDVKSTLSIEISSVPRSDIVVTFYGNNIYFDPPHVVFTAGGETKKTISVTPLHATSYELDYAPFKVNYICTGTNSNDYLCPAETHHYVALPQLYIAAIIIAIVGTAIVVLLIFWVTRVCRDKSRQKRDYVPISSSVVIKNTPATSGLISRNIEDDSHSSSL